MQLKTILSGGNAFVGRIKFLLCAFIGLLLFTGCSLWADGKQNSGTVKGQDTLTVLTHDSFKLDDKLIAEFERTSGYKLVFTTANDGMVLNNLRLKKDAPVVDVFFGIDSFNANALLAEDLAEKYVPAGIAKEQVLGEKLTPIDQGDVCLNVDKTWFAQAGIAPPQSFSDLADPTYRGLTVLTSPLTSTPGFAFLAATVERYGDNWIHYWKNLQENDVKVVDDWSTAYFTDFSGADGAGDYPVVLSYSSSPAYSAGRTVSLPDTCISQIEYAGIVRGASNIAGAKKFIDFLLTPSVQASIPEAMYMYPIIAGVDLPSDWAQYAPLPESPLVIDGEKVRTQRQQWLDKWSTEYLGN